MSWEVCRIDNNYEINTEYPYPIRKISNKYVVSEWNNGNGYLRCVMSVYTILATFGGKLQK